MSAVATILCIDDEALGLHIRKTVLEKAGYRVLTATDGASGLGLFDCEPIDAVVLDYSMPGMNGGQVASAMRRSKPGIPIMLLSAYMHLPEDVTSEVDTFVTKGEGAQVLLSKVAQLVESARSAEGGNG
ncbi:MAG TPA: response regulator [Acidisarcina sp.]